MCKMSPVQRHMLYKLAGKMGGELDPDGVEAELWNDCLCKPENVDLFYILGRISPWRKRLIMEMRIFGERLFLIQFPRAVGKHFVYGTWAIESHFRTFKSWMMIAHFCGSVEVRINLIMATVLGGQTGVGKAGEAWLQILNISDKKIGNVYDDYKMKAISFSRAKPMCMIVCRYITAHLKLKEQTNGD